MEKQRIPVTLKKTAVFKRRKEANTVRDIGVLILRLTMGGLLAGHGSQMLFGWFGGSGLKGTASWLESLGLKPGTPWAAVATASEFGGGTLTALGLLHPLGPIATMGGMVMAAVKAHWGKPIWVTEGGAELPILNLAVALALALGDPGRFSLDRLFGIRVPRELVAAVTVVEAALVVNGIMTRPTPALAPSVEQPTPPVEHPTTMTDAAERTERGAGTL
jgi:putative oxidoreductase